MKEDLTNKELEIKEIADGLSFEIDTDSLWANIEPQLPPAKEKNRAPFWWMAAGLFVFVGALASWSLYPNNTNNHIINEGVEVSSFASNRHNTNTHNLTAQQSKVNLQSKDQSRAISQSKYIETEISDKELNSTSNLKSNTEKHTHSHPTNYDDGHSHDTMNNSDITNSGSRTNEVSIVHQPIVSVIDDNKSAENIENIEVDDKVTQPSIESDQVNRSEIYVVSSIMSLNPKRLVNASGLDMNFPIIEPVKNSNWLPYWQLNSGVNKSLSKTMAHDIGTEGNTQTDYEQNLIGLSTSLQYGKENAKGWRWFGGLSYDKLVTRYSNFDESIDTANQWGEASKTIDSEGNEFVTFGDVQVTTIVQNDIIWHRSHDYLNLNVGLGKRLLLINRLSLVGDVYSNYNIWSSHDGYYLEKDELTITKFDRSESNPYQNQGLGLGGKVAIEYDLGSFSIGISSLYQRALKNTTISNNNYQLKNSHYGVQLGVVYRP